MKLIHSLFRVTFTGIALFGLQKLQAQPYIEGGKTRHRFAQLNLGTEFRTFPGNGTFTTTTDVDGNLSVSELETMHQALLTIGGTHFWGHADFYVSFPVFSSSKTGYYPGVETGFRCYPWAITDRKLRPFAGFAWTPSNYRQENGAALTRNEFPLTAGITYNRGPLLFEISGAYSVKSDQGYYITPTEQVPVRTHALRIAGGIKWMLETSAGAEKNWESGYTQRLTDTLARLKRLNSFTLGIGAAAALFLKPSSHNSDLMPFLYQHKFTSLCPDLGAGYYMHSPDLQLNVSFRSIRSEQSGFGATQLLKRRSLSFEAFTFLGDYHGFAPFAGPILSTEWLSVSENLQEEQHTYKKTLLRPGVIAGWDIRPNRLQGIYLRTNLRWYPLLELATRNGKQMVFDQLEIDFIQVVVFIDRLF